jgi:hypothetical protein
MEKAPKSKKASKKRERAESAGPVAAATDVDVPSARRSSKDVDAPRRERRVDAAAEEEGVASSTAAAPPAKVPKTKKAKSSKKSKGAVADAAVDVDAAVAGERPGRACVRVCDTPRVGSLCCRVPLCSRLCVRRVNLHGVGACRSRRCGC